MKQIDHDGLLLCSIQGNVFEQSIRELKCSSEVFIRRFMNSKVSTFMDSTAFLDDTMSIDNIFDELNDEYGETDYGSEKYSNDAMYWIGYIYRYLCYTYEVSGKKAYKLIKAKNLASYYKSFHTMDPASALEEILKLQKLEFDEESIINEYYKVFRRIRMEDEITLEKMTTSFAHDLFKDFVNDYSLFATKEEYREYIYEANKIDKYVEEQTNKGRVLLVILKGQNAIGEIRFKDFKNGKCELGIVLKDDSVKNKGYGTKALKLALKYLKTESLADNVYVTVLENNLRSQHVFEKLGFKYLETVDCFKKYEREV